MTLYLIIGIVAVVVGAVVSRQWTLKAISSLAKEAGADGAMAKALEERAKRRDVADRKRRPLAVRRLGESWRDLWIRRGTGG